MAKSSLGKKMSDSVCVSKISAPSPTPHTPISASPPAHTSAQIPAHTPVQIHTPALTSAKPEYCSTNPEKGKETIDYKNF